ncbi:MAG: glycoside hydrolase family 88 protein [Candidatus Marinimicrobia bacterium]|nr:glycoside hydrolase family 88 protein [Candidatus Neomarinimicrobiota bacterium]
MRRILVLILGLLIWLSPGIGDSGSTLLTSVQVKKQMKAVAKYQIKNPSRHRSKNRDFPNGWVPASFYIGVMAAHEATGDKYYLKQARKWAEANNYAMGPRLRHADDHACGSVYLSLHADSPKKHRIEAVRAVYDTLMSHPKLGRKDWSWCDALFMSPPTLAQLGQVTGQKKYHKFLHQLYWDTAEHLFDKNEALFYRDQRYFYRRSANGYKVFWSRGNGWVIAGLPRIIVNLPEKDKQRQSYIELFKTLAASLVVLQGEDGLWRSSLLDAAEYPNPESSGSGFITYALAWGVNQGHLDPAKYESAVILGWSGLVQAVHEDGKIGWVQDIGMDPRDVSYDDTHAYGAGAFLLAGSEMIKLLENRE